jgi:hypothetical protein
MKVIINLEDSFISVDGVQTHDMDFTEIDSSIHALEWDDSVNKGDLEYKDNQNNPNFLFSSTSEVDSKLGVTLQSILDKRDKLIADRKAASDAIIAAENE